MGPLTRITTQGQSRPGSNGNLEELHLPQTLELPNWALPPGAVERHAQDKSIMQRHR